MNTGAEDFVEREECRGHAGRGGQEGAAAHSVFRCEFVGKRGADARFDTGAWSGLCGNGVNSPLLTTCVGTGEAESCAFQQA